MKKVSLFIFIILGLFLIPFTTAKAAPGDRLNLAGIEVNWSYQYEGYWYDELETYGYYQFEANSDYETNLNITSITFDQLEIHQNYQFIIFDFGDSIFQFYINDIYQIDFTKITSAGPEYEITLGIYYNGSIGPENVDFKVGDVGLNLYITDSRYSGSVLNYNQGKRDGRKEYIDTELPDIIDAYYYSGYEDAIDDFYVQRYNEGRASVEAENNALVDYIPGILGVVIAFFFQLASISFAGVSILDVVVMLFGVTLALMIFKIFFGGK